MGLFISSVFLFFILLKSRYTVGNTFHPFKVGFTNITYLEVLLIYYLKIFHLEPTPNCLKITIHSDYSKHFKCLHSDTYRLSPWFSIRGPRHTGALSSHFKCSTKKSNIQSKMVANEKSIQVTLNFNNGTIFAYSTFFYSAFDFKNIDYTCFKYCCIVSFATLFVLVIGKIEWYK